MASAGLLHSIVEQLDGSWKFGQPEVANTQPVGIPFHVWELSMNGAQLGRFVVLCRYWLVAQRNAQSLVDGGILCLWFV